MIEYTVTGSTTTSQTWSQCRKCGRYYRDYDSHSQVCMATGKQQEKTLDEPKKASEIQIGGSHYQEMKIQPNAYIHANGLNWFAGNIVKYASRAGRKGGVEGMKVDIEKAKHYAELWLERINEGEVK